MFLNKPHVFDDGSSILWVDRETLRYTQDGRSALVWVDYAPGLFNGQRIIRISSLDKWERRPENTLAEIDDESRSRIIDKVFRYYEARGTRVTLEE
jgi:hypothetical protein